MKILYMSLAIVLLLYLGLPNPAFPFPPSDSLQSFEPADIETPLRKAYFTNYTREEVIVHYKKQLNNSALMGISLPIYILNYPPEEAQTIIRDQTQSTFLEEIVHPFRESLFINGFEATEDKDVIIREGKVWRQKITIKYIPSSLIYRLIIFGSGLALACVVLFEFVDVFVRLFKKK